MLKNVLYMYGHNMHICIVNCVHFAVLSIFSNMISHY